MSLSRKEVRELHRKESQLDMLNSKLIIMGLSYILWIVVCAFFMSQIFGGSTLAIFSSVAVGAALAFVVTIRAAKRWLKEQQAVQKDVSDTYARFDTPVSNRDWEAWFE